MDATQLATVEQVLKDHGIRIKRVYLDHGNVMARFRGQRNAAAGARRRQGSEKRADERLRERDVVRVAAPSWLQVLACVPCARPRLAPAALYLLYQVDVNGAVAKLLNTYEQDFRRAFNGDDITIVDISQLTVDSDIPDGLRVLLPAGADLSKVRDSIRSFTLNSAARCGRRRRCGGDCVLTAQQVRERRDFGIQQNITTLRNRVNELGVSSRSCSGRAFDRNRGRNTRRADSAR